MISRPLSCAIGLAGAVLFLGLALYQAPPAAVGAVLVRTDPIWLCAALAVYALNLSLRAWRWQVILRPVAELRYPIVARVLLIGYGLNTIMPARLGELFRAEFLRKACGLPRAPALTSIVVERLLDGLAVVLCLGVGLLLASRGGRAPRCDGGRRDLVRGCADRRPRFLPAAAVPPCCPLLPVVRAAGRG